MATLNDRLTNGLANARATLRGALMAVLLSAGQLVAQSVAVPEGCEAVATSHNNSCVTKTIARCEGGWQAISYRKGRLLGVSYYSSDWDFLKWEAEGSVRMTFEMVPGTGKALDAQVLQETGRHEASARFVINTNVLKDEAYVLTGATEATGAVVTLGDETFVTYEGVRNFRRESAESTLNFRFDLLFSQSRDLMLEGRSARAINDSNWQEFATEPMALRGPGEPGFLATTSEFGCG